jgi:hypothetical protein
MQVLWIGVASQRRKHFIAQVSTALFLFTTGAGGSDIEQRVWMQD